MSKQFRLLRADEIECRISQTRDTMVQLLLYKTARTDADLLDETVGAGRWENDFKLVDDVLYGGIGVDYEGNGHYVWKWDAGVESNAEAEKGRASDAFKRAGFKHGIGRELYSSPQITIWADKAPITIKKIKDKNGKEKPACFDTFDVKEIAYDGQERVKDLVITANGKVAFEFHKSGQKAVAKKPEPKSEPKKDAFSNPPSQAVTCTECDRLIEDTEIKGVTYTAEFIVNNTIKRYGRPVCTDCAVKLSEGAK